MASTKADNNRVEWTYHTDVEASYSISAKAVYVLDGTDGAKYGGEAGDGSGMPIPKGFRPRAVKVISAAGKKLWVPVYDTAAALWTTPGTTVTRCINGVDTVCTATSDHRGERHPRPGTRDVA